MRRFVMAVAVFGALSVGGTAVAQEHWTEGPVWGCSAFRTKQGQFDTYLKYLREHYLPTSAEAKRLLAKAVLCLSRPFFTALSQSSTT